MFVKLLDIFINKKAHDDPDLLFKFRSLAAVILAFCLLDCIVIFFIYSKTVQFFLSYIMWSIALTALIVVTKQTTNFNLAAFAFILFTFGLTTSVVYFAGDLYSYNMKWFILIVLFGIIFNFRANGVLPFIYLLISLTVILVFYFIESNDNVVNVEELRRFNKTDFLIENIMHSIVFSTVLFFYYLVQNRLLVELNEKKEVLQQQYNLNLIKTGELKKIKEKLEETNRDLRSYAFATSHDLKEPLRTITSFIQLLKMELNEAELTADAKEYLNYVELGSKRMNNLVEDALVLSKVENIKRESFENIDLNKLVTEVVIDLNNQVKRANAIIKRGKLPVIKGNRVEIKRLFQNLVSNAVKFNRQNVKPVIYIYANLKNGLHLFFIEDNGIGIETENLKTIFEPYKRVNENREGTGLGLTICKKIVELHQGKIWAEANQSCGTVFKFTIPAIVAS